MPAPVVAAAARAGAGKGTAAKAAGSRTASTKAAAATRAGQAQRQRAAIDAIKAARQPEQPRTEVVDAGPADRSRMNSRTASAGGTWTDQRGAPRWYPGDVDKLKAANAGGGFALGLFGYVLALTYLDGGRAGVKAWLKAKFLNQVES